MSLVDTTTGEIVELTTAEARALTDEIKHAAERVWSLLLQAHERGAWKALEYPTWESYVRAEFDMSRSRSYQILDQGRVVREITAAAGVSTMVDIDEREARDLRPHLPHVAAAVRERVERLPLDAAPVERERIVREIVTEARATLRPAPDPTLDDLANQLGDDDTIARARLLRDFHNGVRALTRDLLPLDAAALAEAIVDDDDRQAAETLIREARLWLAQLDRRMHGLALIQGGRA